MKLDEIRRNRRTRRARSTANRGELRNTVSLVIATGIVVLGVMLFARTRSFEPAAPEPPAAVPAAPQTEQTERAERSPIPIIIRIEEDRVSIGEDVIVDTGDPPLAAETGQIEPLAKALKPLIGEPPRPCRVLPSPETPYSLLEAVMETARAAGCATELDTIEQP